MRKVLRFLLLIISHIFGIKNSVNPIINDKLIEKVEKDFRRILTQDDWQERTHNISRIIIPRNKIPISQISPYIVHKSCPNSLLNPKNCQPYFPTIPRFLPYVFSTGMSVTTYAKKGCLPLPPISTQSCSYLVPIIISKKWTRKNCCRRSGDRAKGKWD